MAKNRKSHIALASVAEPVSPVILAAEAATEVAADAAHAAVEAALPETAAAILAIAPVVAVAPKLASAKKWPKHGGKCFAVWQKCQQLADSGVHVNVGMLRDWAVAEGANVSNATQEFYAWRKYVSANS
jgi:hypothetical protein